jgi:hypothetical protein
MIKKIQVWLYLWQLKKLLPHMERYREERLRDGKSVEVVDSAIAANKKVLQEQGWR